MNNENENMTGVIPSPAVPLETQGDGMLFQNAGGIGRGMTAQAYPNESVPTVRVEPAQVNVQMPEENPVAASPNTYTPEENVPVMQENPNVKVASINLNAASDLNQEEDYEELEEYIEPEKTEEDLDLERRNRSGMRFLVIFGLIVLIFILLLPFLITII